jgi:predicted lactoylglutathione lyase
MNPEFPAALPEIPVSDINKGAFYYVNNLGFKMDWGDEDGGIAGISNGHCRMFLTNPAFRVQYGNTGPVLIWLNLNSKQEVSDLYDLWKHNQVRIISEPEEKPWKLHEFTAMDLDGNLFRVFYDFSSDPDPA